MTHAFPNIIANTAGSNFLSVAMGADLPTATRINGTLVENYVDTRIAAAAAPLVPRYAKLSFNDTLIPDNEGAAIIPVVEASLGMVIDPVLNTIQLTPGSYAADLRAFANAPFDSNTYRPEIFEVDVEGNVVRPLAIAPATTLPGVAMFTFSTPQTTYIRFYINNESNDSVTFRCLSWSVTRLTAFPSLS